MLQNAKIEELAESLKAYANTNFELLKCETAERTAVVGSGFISSLLVGLAGILFVFFISLELGFYISTRFGNNYSGFLIVAGFYFLLSFVLIIGRKKLLEKPIRDKIIQQIFSEK